MRFDFVLDDTFGQSVRQRALNPITDFDAQLPVLHEHEQYGAVPLLCQEPCNLLVAECRKVVKGETNE